MTLAYLSLSGRYGNVKYAAGLTIISHIPLGTTSSSSMTTICISPSCDREAEHAERSLRGFPFQRPASPSLFTGVRGRGILRSSFAGSCIDLALRGVRMASEAHHAARVSEIYMLWWCIKIRGRE